MQTSSVLGLLDYICYVIEPECPRVILRRNCDISPLSCKYFAPCFILPVPLCPPKYQNLWVSIFPVENYHSLS